MNNSKTIFVTGGSSGFGESISKQAINAGYNVIATFRHQKQVDAFNDSAENAFGVLLDITNSQQIAEGVEKALEKFKSIDVLVNNAGYGEFGVVEAIDEDTYHKQFNTNVLGTLNMIKAVLPHMRENKAGHIINFSSIGGLMSMPVAGIYCASKAAIEGLTMALREEVKDFNIKTTLIEPGAFDTRFGENSTFDELKSDTPEAYQDYVDGVIKMFEDMMGDTESMGDPDKLAAIVMHVINNDIDTLHVPVGKDSVDGFKKKIDMLQEAVDQWEELSSQMSNSDTLPKKLAA